MRHLWSLLAGVVVAPLTWCLVALGQNGSQEKVGDWVNTRRWDSVDLIEPAAYLVVAGILVGLIATLRISPVGPLVCGLLLVAAYVGLFISPLDVRDAVPDDWAPFDQRLPLRVPLDNGTLALIGVLLIMAVFSANRWRSWPSATALAAPGASLDAPGAPAQPVGEAPTTPPKSPEPEPEPAAESEAQTVSISADSAAEAAAAEKSAAPSVSSRTSAESPWSAPPGQSPPEKS